MLVILCQMIRDAANGGVDASATQVLSGHIFTGSGLNQGWTGKKNGACSLNNNTLVRHGWDIGTASRAKTMNRGDLGNSLGTHARLIIKNTSKIVFVRKYF